MAQGESPLDFIQKNIAQSTVVPSVQVPPPIPPVTPVVVETAPAKTPDVIPLTEDPKPTFGFDEEKKVEEVKAEPIVDDDIIPENPEKEHWVKLRTKTKELKESLSQTQAERDELKQKVTRYETGEVVPEILHEQEERITKLSHYEKLHNLKMSSEYTDKFTKPINSTVSRLRETFTEYGVPPEQVDQAITHAMNTGSRTQLNAFLSDVFSDTVGAEEAKKDILSLKQLQTDASEAEKEPGKILEHLQEEAKKIQTLKQQERIGKISENARTSWADSLNEIRSENQVHELIRRVDDPEFNAKFVDPILTKSAQEYGRIVTELTRLGIEEIPKELAKGLAKLVSLAYASSTAIASRDAAINRLSEVESSADRLNNLMRPRVGGGNANGSKPAATPAALTPQQAADQLINSVLHKK